MASLPPPLEIFPPLINSANPWATTLEDLRALYACPSTGAVTTRTSLVKGFPHDPEKHYYVFLDPASHEVSREATGKKTEEGHLTQNASLNSLGYSPITLEMYLGFIKTIVTEEKEKAPAAITARDNKKGFIVSVTGSPEEVAECYTLIARFKKEIDEDGLDMPLYMEINLSCPNIPNKPPPAYSREALGEYLDQLRGTITSSNATDLPRIPFGLKTPPFTHSTEYEVLMGALEDDADRCPGSGGVSQVSFLTATNTLGSCLAFSSPPLISESPSSTSSFETALPGYGTGGMAGAPLHPLALGNVATLRRILDAQERKQKLGHVRVVGIGGVLDAAGYRRMRAVGASLVGIGTGLGLKGVGIFGEIEKGLDGRW